MEDLLINLSKEALNYKCSAVHKASTEAYALLECQQGATRDPPHMLREKCFLAINLALETKRSKLIAIAINGIYKMIRDDRFQANIEPEDDSYWFPSQLIRAFNSILVQSDDTQVDMLKVLLYVACSKYWTVNGRIIIQILTVCSEIYETGTLAIKSATKAASSQILCSFCHFLDEECQEIDLNEHSSNCGVMCFNEAIPILQFMCSRIDESQSGNRSSQNVVFYLECLHTLISNLPQKIQANRHFVMFLWQKFCPVLIAYLGSPRVDKKIISREDRQAGESSEAGRGSGGIASALGFDSHQSKIIYNIGNQLVRLVGCVGSLRPVLESVYHRMLLYPPPQHRLEALSALKEVLRSVSRTVDFAGPILIEDDKQQCCQQSDMALTRLVMDSIEESSRCGRLDILSACVSCVLSLVNTLMELCDGTGISEKYVEKINSTFSSMTDCDYTGPLTYDSSSRLPNTYREILKFNLRSESNDSFRSRSSSGHSSGDTEGPEEGYQHNESEVDEPSMEIERKKLEREAERLDKIQKVSDFNETVVIKRDDKITSSIDIERENARHFAKTLVTFLSSLLRVRSTLQVDQALQEFSSKYSQNVMDTNDSKEYGTIMNADGIYLATYASLRLNLRLINLNYYGNFDVVVPISEGKFVEDVQSIGVLIYMTASWLSELYQQVLISNLLEEAGYNPRDSNDYLPLINLLSDVDVELCRNESRLLSDYQRLERAYGRSEITPEIEAGRKLSRRILTCCWKSMVDVLSTSLQYSSTYNKTSRLRLLRKNKNNEMLLKICFSDSLETLQKAAQLSNTLGLQSRCGSIFSLLVSAACPGVPDDNKKIMPSFLDYKNKLYSSQVLSMDVILSRGLELGSYAPDCWNHIFRCASYVSHLEQRIFHKTKGSAMKKSAIKDKFDFNTAAVTPTEDLKLAFASSDADEDEIMDVYSFLATSPSPVISFQEQTVNDLINDSKCDSNGGVISNDFASRIICVLSQKIDRLFDEAALKLNLDALHSFVSNLCAASHTQLFTRLPNLEIYGKHWWKIRNLTKFTPVVEPGHSLFLSRINQVMMKCIKSGRPLIHIMKIWSVVGPHYIEAACSKEQNISKISVTCIHDTITSLLNEQVELPHFHFNEALFKPFEILLCLELCDADIQDQIVSCICELVEGNRADIRSGWRSLFGGLKMINSAHLATLLEVFRVFLDTDNTLVFSNAAVDFITCLLRHVRGPDGASSDVLSTIDTERGLKLAAAALKYLLQCCGILESMYNMPACPVFNTTYNNQIKGTCVDPIIPDKEIIYFEEYDPLSASPNVSYAPLLIDSCKVQSLNSLDKPNRILRVWAAMIENLSYVVVIAQGKFQAQAMDTLFIMLSDLVTVPGIEFALFCLNTMIISSVQTWLRKIPSNGLLDSADSESVTNFKQCCGNVTDLTVRYFYHLSEKMEVHKGEFALKQLMLLLIEVIAHAREGIARLGCSCLRHVILSIGSLLDDELWTVVCVTLHKACAVSLHPLIQLMAAFYPCSQSFYGDLAKVKVAARRDSSPEENYRIKQLAQQIFLLENQCEEFKQSDGNVDEDRSYVLLLCYDESPDGSHQKVIRIPFRNIAVGLLANQLLLQTIATLLIQGTPRVIPSLANVLLQSSPVFDNEARRDTKLFGLTSYMRRPHISTLLSCLDFSYEKAMSFDSRPGLKFLMQKVSGLEKAPNLYKQAGACWTLKIVALVELYLYEARGANLNMNLVKSHVEMYDRRYDNSNDFTFDENIFTNYEPAVVYIFYLRQTFDRLCEKYVDVILDKDGMYSIIDSVNDQPIFFLISQVEELAELTTTKSRDDARSDNDEWSKRFSSDDEEHHNNLKADSLCEGLVNDEEADSTDAESVYTMASSKNIDSVVAAYARRKKSCAMLPTYQCERKKYATHVGSTEPLPPEIEQQRKTSINKDSEAHLAVWAEVLISVFDILAQLTPDEFHLLLPILFNGVRNLTAHATHPSLKHALAEFFHRVAVVYGFSP